MRFLAVMIAGSLASLALAALAHRWELPALRFGAAGLFGGLALGDLLQVMNGLSFLFGWPGLRLPPMTVGESAFTAAVWLPMALGLTGMVCGMMLSLIPKAGPR